MDLLSLGSSIGLSAPLTLLTMAALHHLGMGPPFLEAVAERHPWVVSAPVVASAAVLYLFEVLSAKSKLTKPVKQAYDLALGVVKPVATVIFGLAVVEMGTSRWREDQWVLAAGALPVSIAGVDLGAMDLLRLGLAALVALLVHGVRAMVDFLAWLKPVPFVDAAVSTVAEVYTLGMMALVAFLPAVAAAAFLLQALACALLAGWLRRVSGAALRLTSGIFGSSAPSTEPVPGWIAATAGGAPAVPALVERGRPWGRWAKVHLAVLGGELLVFGRRRLRRRCERVRLAGRTAQVTVGLVADRLSLRDGGERLVLAFPKDRFPDLRALEARLSAAGVPLEGAAGLRAVAAM